MNPHAPSGIVVLPFHVGMVEHEQWMVAGALVMPIAARLRLASATLAIVKQSKRASPFDRMPARGARVLSAADAVPAFD